MSAIGCFVERDSQDQMNFNDILELTQERKDLLVLLVTNDLCDQTILQNMQKLTWRVARPVILIQMNSMSVKVRRRKRGVVKSKPMPWRWTSCPGRRQREGRHEWEN